TAAQPRLLAQLPQDRVLHGLPLLDPAAGQHGVLATAATTVHDQQVPLAQDDGDGADPHRAPASAGCSRAVGRRVAVAGLSTAARNATASGPTSAPRSPGPSPRNPSVGGPTRKAREPITEARATRAAGFGPESPAAESASGKPREAPSPHSTTAATAATWLST